ncbi:hypothetical protein QE422_001681 [Chryseobacterium sp. SORGH_AS 447]|uniref:hypothetical protein n=1 Tax=Chryseobacterium sp. SORGH_AS_0447 TaxID=3041769 RepID=UPI0027897CC9|nr:hypothetical protein [Chryseobacterium sp. SORGH_AS_0447]MDQ1161313.1 hypothetical protein [Chryseobacterium sp. SORGH_AS_0447]
MKKRTLYVFNFIIMFSIYGCNSSLGKWNVDELFAQQIEGSSKLLYKYNAWGGRDSNANGFVILDSTKEFKIDLSEELPFYYLSDIPKNFKISGITHDCYNSCGENYYKTNPIFKVMKTENMISNEINITTRIFQYRGYSEKDYSLERYVFEKFKETKDSLFFFNLNDVESENGIHLNELKLRKGEVYLQESDKRLINKIIINEVKLSSKNNNIEYIRTVHLTPKYQTKSSEFSKRGIFKPVKIKNIE